MTTAALYIMDIPKSSHDAKNVVNYVSKLYTNSTDFIYGLGNALLILFVTPVAFAFLIPIALVLIGLIKFSKWRLKKALKQRLNIKFSTYKDTKKIQGDLSNDLEEIQNAITLISDKSAWFDSLFIKDIKDLHGMLLNFQKDLNISLSKLSTYDSSNNLENFELVTEDKLWNNRTEAYQYRL